MFTLIYMRWKENVQVTSPEFFFFAASADCEV